MALELLAECEELYPNLDDFMGERYQMAVIVFDKMGEKSTAHSYFRQAVKRFEKTGREKKALAECSAWIENYENG